MRKAFAFFKRDVLMDVGYRFSFVFHLLGVVASMTSYYFLARFVATAQIPGLQAYGNDYFTFVIVGVALHDYLATGLDAFARSLRESQLGGTLEAVLATPTAVSTVVVSSALYPFVWTSLTAALYLGLGVAVGASLGAGNWGAAAVLFVLAIAVFASLGILSASFVMVFKRGNPVSWLLGWLSWLLGGILYPVSVLPDWLRMVSAALPITYAVDGMRSALLGGAPWAALRPSLLALSAFAVVLVPLSLVVFSSATRWARRAGTLAQY